MGARARARVRVRARCGKPAKPRTRRRRSRSRRRPTRPQVPIGARVLLFERTTSRCTSARSISTASARARPRARSRRASSARGTGSILADGTAEVPIGVDACKPSPAIPYGKYKVWAWRGVEYERGRATVDCRPIAARSQLAIRSSARGSPRHARRRSPRPRARVERLAHAEPAARRRAGRGGHPGRRAHRSQHRTAISIAEITALGLDDRIASIAGNELTSNAQHINVYPVPLDRNLPRGGAPPDEGDRRRAARSACSRSRTR